MMIWIIVVIAAVLHACIISEKEVHKISEAKDNALVKYGNA